MWKNSSKKFHNPLYYLKFTVLATTAGMLAFEYLLLKVRFCVSTQTVVMFKCAIILCLLEGIVQVKSERVTWKKMNKFHTI